jgi:hypothetical protein
MSPQEVERKFMSMASAAVGRESAAAILSQANAVFSAPSVKPLNDLLTSCTVAATIAAGQH